MHKGVVKEYNAERGLGTIVDSDTGELLIVYANFISLKLGEDLKASQEVEYDIENNQNRSWAINVKIVNAAPKGGSS